MSALEQLQQECSVDLVVVAATVERLNAGATFVELLDDRIESRAASLAAVLEHLSDDSTKLIWTGNPLRAPLTIERLILQAAGPDADLRVERTAEELAHMLTLSAQTESRRILIVQQPETLDPLARDMLEQMEPALAASMPRIQILFCGTNAFHPVQRAARPPATPRKPLALLTIEPEHEAQEPRASRREVAPLLLLLAATAVGSLWTPPLKPIEPHAPTSALASRSTPSQAQLDVAALRREFDQFLAEQPDRVANLTADQRTALFEEYLEHARKSLPDERL